MQIGSFNTLGQNGGGISFNAGTLRTTVSNIGTNRAVTLNGGGGTFEVDTFRTLELNGAIGGTSSLTKTGGGTLVLTANNTYGASTFIEAGTLRLSGSTFANRIPTALF